MRSGPVTIAKIARQNATQVRLAEYDDAVKTLATGTGFGDIDQFRCFRALIATCSALLAPARLCGLDSYVG